MDAIRIIKTLETDGEVRLTGLPFKQGQRIELILLGDVEPRLPEAHRLTSGELLGSGLVGIWKDRPDVEDSAPYARRLREDAQNRARCG